MDQSRTPISRYGVALLALTFTTTQQSHAAGGGLSRLSDEPIPLQTEDFPERPAPLIEWGENPFLGNGFIGPGFETKTGATWQPLFIVYGTFRSALQTFDSGAGTGNITEWSNRLDIFGNLYLTPTERLNIGFRPLDQNNTFSGYRFDDDSNDDNSVNAINGNIESLFFEGDFGEIFPNLDLEDTRSLDFGFSIGRQPLRFQDGLLISDSVDSIGITRSSLFWFGSSAFRITGLYGWSDINRGNNIIDGNSQMVGVFTATDYDKFSIEVDALYTFSDDASGGDQFNFGVAYIRRIGLVNTSVYFNSSFAVDDPAISGPGSPTDDGSLVLAQFSITPPYSTDIVYTSFFWGIDEFRSAARGPSTGGPLGNVGVLFAAVGNGRYGAPLSNIADHSVGAAIGYQKFFNHGRQQLITELGGRVSTNGTQKDAIALGVRYQHAIGKHLIWETSGFGTLRDPSETSYGLRSEFIIKF